MIDLGISKLALIGAVALIVIGPERLPKVARTVGALVGRAQRYINDVKAEVSREVELDELRKMRTEFESAARDVEQTIHKEVNDLNQEVKDQAQAVSDALNGTGAESTDSPFGSSFGSGDSNGFVPSWDAAHKSHNGRKSWRVKQGARPIWFKRQQNTRTWVQSGAARVKRHRPARGAARSFFE
ncbi:Sec-independent protein translocase protein TatB [Cupriavidus plantarum]|uniref:Sec-independent protein translocase protein TatB n=1 Tax=Cupriavidus plantarum TaxID=942865 RepID=A0A316EPY9_9BURK|nr:Sec-independent protein translocase protein TatB [Cupriavidus plantarum]NYI02962.1 sec-independent protein translocase protein TatB [Cupriavidus plantarum]PWK32311.1 sec-independent protein translocase protein TatB [Cupriavidus plantarum]REE87261.1 sec-independent protein translocase protein TatB [Cupriavidus plantarum]RLK29641.1 sec-independent protein translocase protein TatB [Cupriavidus plantarum]CAG2154101.1 Sec-independent protein translocase protein TatB [Cupriavidus plantarum]